MKLTGESKKHIDSLAYIQLLSQWRFSPSGDPWFQGETGNYWSNRMEELRSELNDGEHAKISKTLGW